MVVRDRRARGRRARLGLPDHLLSRRDRRRRRRAEPLRGAPAAVRARRRHRPRGTTLAPRPAHRAQRLRHRRGRASATPRSSCATGAWRAAAAPARAATPRSATSDSAGFAYDLELAATQPVLLQGEDGVSRKGPRPEQTSRYYSEPQLAVRGTLAIEGRSADGHRPRLARPRVERRLPGPGRRRLGLDRHEPRRRQRADGVSHAPRRRQHAVERRQPSRRRRRDARLRRRRGRVHARPDLDQPGVVGALSGRVARRDAGRHASACARCSTTRSSTAGRAPARSTGKACRSSSTPRGARVGRGYLEMTGYAARLVL